MSVAVIASNPAARAAAVHQAVTRLPLHKECLAELSFAFSYSCERLLPQLLSFDTHANYPGSCMGVLRPGVISLPSLSHSCLTLSLSFKLAKNISHPFNRLRTLCQKQPGCTQVVFYPGCLFLFHEGPRGALLLFASLFCRPRQLMFFLISCLRTLYQNTRV